MTRAFVLEHHPQAGLEVDAESPCNLQESWRRVNGFRIISYARLRVRSIYALSKAN